MTAETFVARREAMGLTQGGLAGLLGLTERAVQYYEAGRTPVPVVVALALQTLEGRKGRRA